ncbi:TPA: hypothetical protein ACH3X2_007499 [Trebouxia sp. C0005]
MVQWLRITTSRLANSKVTLASTKSLYPACQVHRFSRTLSCKRSQHTHVQGAETRSKAFHARRHLLSSAAFAASAIVIWYLRQTTPDLLADVNTTQRPSGQQEPKQVTQIRGLKSAVQARTRDWRSLFATMNSSHADLINSLRQTERLTDKTAQTMLQVDRKYFLDPDNLEVLHHAYQDHPVPIGYGETISAPHMHAEALRLLEDHCPPGASVLDVGSGSGYLTGCFGIMVGDDGQVLGVEKHKELAHRSIQSLQQAVPDLMKKGTIKIMPGNVLGKVLGEYGPFDAIHVGAAAASMPQNLIQKLKPGGRMVIPVGEQNAMQVLKLVDKDEQGKVQQRDLMGVAYVPLTEPGMDPFVGKDEE